MSKIAINLSVFGASKKDLQECLDPFYKALDPNSFNVYVSNCILKPHFKYKNINENDETEEYFKINKENRNNIFFKKEFTGKYYEHEARNLCFPFNGEELVWIVDADEFYTVDQIKSIVQYVDSKPFIDVFKIKFKNYIFDGKHYILDFMPPRIYRSVTNSQWDFGGFESHNDGFYYDSEANKHSLNDCAVKIIPARTVDGGIKHMTWLHTNGKKKWQYQMDHYGHCSYTWDEHKQKIRLDENYYRKYNIPIPKIYKDNA